MHKGGIRDGGGSWAHIQWVSLLLMSGGSPHIGPNSGATIACTAGCGITSYKLKLQVTSVCAYMCALVCLHVCVLVCTCVCVCACEHFVLGCMCVYICI